MHYAELHCHSNYSFLDGASSPADLVAEAARLGLPVLALTDHNGLYGVVEFAGHAREAGVRTVFGAELTLSPGPRAGVPDPPGDHLIVLARNPDGYARLSRVIAEAHLAGGEKGRPIFTLENLASAHHCEWAVTTACRKGTVVSRLEQEGPAAARRELARLVDAFGQDNVFVELWNHADPVDSVRNDALAEIAYSLGVETIATNNVHYATPHGHRLACTLGAVRANKSLAEMEEWMPCSPAAHLRSASEQSRMLSRWPGTMERAWELGLDCAFNLKLIAPGLPNFDVPAGYDEQSWLAHLTEAGAVKRYGPRDGERVPGAWKQIDYELDIIGKLGFPGYFLIVWEIVEFCRAHNIYCQGRGSAANSAVCFVLGITRADAVSLGLLFERFLSPARDGPPDIDLDIESGRRDEVIAHVFERYGRNHAAQVANLITYRPRSAVRDMGRACGLSEPEVAAWATSLEHRGAVSADEGDPSIRLPAELAVEILGFPRHLGLHPGGMVICDRPVVEVCPVEWARKEGRTVLQWDKESCAAAGLVKFDLLGLGMLEVLHRCVDLIGEHHHVDIDLAEIPQEDCVYESLCNADTIGVFQVESGAQMNTLPRLAPRCFFDLVVEVALIRPGPIQGNSVHPYLRRRSGEEEPTYLHPILEKSLAKTLGVPIFQEQLMQIAIDAAGFSPVEADELRQAMAAKRSIERMERLRGRLMAGLALNGIEGEAAENIYAALSGFASFGFPESHAVSFAYLVYSSAWLRYHYPAAYCAAILNSQPMGFWNEQSLVADARRHGVEIRPVVVNRSRAEATLEWDEGATRPAVRLGLGSVRSIGPVIADTIAVCGPYATMEELVRRTGITRSQLEALATAGALVEVEIGGAPGSGTSAGSRRAALWAAGPIAESTPDRLPGLVVGETAPSLPEISGEEEIEADIWATGLTLGPTSIELARPRLDALGVTRAADLATYPSEARVTIAGAVTHRQHPETAKGATFLTLEDETGIARVTCSAGAWVHYRDVAGTAPALLIRGRLEKVGSLATSLRAEKIVALDVGSVPGSRNFR